MKSPMKKRLSVLLSLMLTMLMLMSVSVSAMSTDVTPDPAQALGGGTLTITGSVAGDSADEINEVLDKSSIVFGYELAQQLKTTLKLITDGAELFTVRTAADAEQFVIEIPQVYANSLLINYEALFNNLGTQLQTLLDEMGIDLEELIGNLVSSLSIPTVTTQSEDMEEILAPYSEILMENIQNCTKVQQDAEITLKYGAGTLTGDVYTWAPTAEEFADLLQKTGTVMKEDSRLIDLYRQQMEQQRPMFSMYASMGADFTEEDLDEAYAEIDEILDQLPDLLIDNAEEYGQAMAGIGLQVNVAVVDGAPVAAVLSFDEGAGRIVSIGYENADGDYYFYFDEAGTDYALRCSFDETDEETSFRADVLAGGFPMASFTLNVSKVEVTRLGIPAVFADLEIGTSFSCSALLNTYDDMDMLTLSVDGIDSLTGTTDITGFEINASLTDESGAEDIQQESIDISGFTVEEFSDLFEKIGEGFNQYFGTGY